MYLRYIAVGAIALFAVQPTFAQDRYTSRPPVVVSPDLAAPWVLQLQNQPGNVVQQRRVVRRQQQPVRRSIIGRQAIPSGVHTASIVAPTRKAVMPQMDPAYLPQQVAYDGGHKPGTIVIDTSSKFLYLVQSDGQARRYGVGVGKEGMVWSGTETITRKAEWPNWHPPKEMIDRELREKGRVLPAFMAGGEQNPLGARALYLGSTLYRIHGTNAPWTIGTNVSSGCIRLRNEDVIDLYSRVDVGTKVVVI